MNKTAKICFIVAASLILVGCMIFGGMMAMLKWDFKKLSTHRLETNEYEITENYKNITIISDTADITFVASDSSKTSIVCYDEASNRHLVSVTDDTLEIKNVDTRKWYHFIGMDFSSPKITVYLPTDEYGALSIKEDTGDVNIPKELSFESIDISVSTGDIKLLASASGTIKIKSSTGDMRLEGISADSLDLTSSTGDMSIFSSTVAKDINLKVTTGDTFINNVSCAKLISGGDTGEISLTNVTATGIFSINRSTGDVKLDSCDASELFIETSTGDVNGTLRSDKIFITKSSTGDIDVPASLTGGRCEITTDTGDINIKIK